MDKKEKDRKPEMNLALAKLANPGTEIAASPENDHIGDCYAHFAETLERKIKEELTAEVHDHCLAAACEPFGLPPSEDTHKIPDVMFHTLQLAREQGRECQMLQDVVRAMWRFFGNGEIGNPQAAPRPVAA